MPCHRQRPILIGLVAILAAWALAWGGYHLAQSSRMTADKVQAYLRATDLSQLQGDARARALRDLAAMLNKLSIEERRKARMDRLWNRWLSQMTDEEKAAFLEATLPSGIRQMLTAFEKLPEDKRKKTIDDALKQLQDARDQSGDGANGEPPVLNPALRQKVVTAGLNTYYNQSSAQTKAELAPLLEEIQRSMENGRAFRPPHGPHD